MRGTRIVRSRSFAHGRFPTSSPRLSLGEAMAPHALRHLCGWQRGGSIDQDSYDYFAIQASRRRLNWIITSWYPDSTLELDSEAASLFIRESCVLPRPVTLAS